MPRAMPAPAPWCTSRRSARTSGRSPLCAHQGGRRGGRAEDFPGAVILRPSLVFGPEDQLFNRFAAMARVSPFLPLIGGGRTKLQPVYAGDVGAAIAAACAGKAKPGHDLRARRARGRHLPPAARPDAGVVRPQAPLSCASPSGRPSSARCSPLPLPNGLRPLTVDQVRMLQSDNVVSKAAQAEGRTLAGLGIDAPAHHGGGRAGLPRALPAARPVRALSRVTPGLLGLALAAAGR